MYSVIIEKSKISGDNVTKKRYDFEGLEKAINRYTDFCVIYKGEETQALVRDDMCDVDVFFLHDDKFLDHRFFSTGCYA